MARFTLRVTDEQLTTVSFDGTDGIWTQYRPAIPVTQAVTALSATQSGGEQTAFVLRNPDETCRVQFRGSIETVRTTIARLNQLFRQAELFQQRHSTSFPYPVYLEVQRPTSGAWLRSEILNGRIELADDALDTQWSTGYVEAVLYWTRRYYWEATNGTLLPLSNRNGSNVFAGLTVYNHRDTDAGHDNYVDIAGADIAGDLPGPVVLTVTSNAASTMGDLAVAIGSSGTPLTSTHFLEAETGRVGGSTLASGTASNGGYTQQTVNTSWGECMRWTLDGSFLSGLGGSLFRLLARFYTAPAANTQVKAQLTSSPGSGVLWEGPAYMLNTANQLQEIGVLQLPPQPVGRSNFGTIYLSLYGKNTGGAVTLNTDYVQLTWLDSWRQYKAKAGGVAFGSQLIDDGQSGQLYTSTAGTNRLANYVAYGAPLLLRPGVDHRIYFLNQDTSGGADATRTMSVQITHYPRRLTL